MRKTSVYLCLSIAVFFTLVFSSCPAPANDRTLEFTYISDVTREVRSFSGINLGNALEAPDEGEWGVVLEEEYFELIRNAGFNYLRIPIRWPNHALAGAPYTINADFMARVDWAVDNALNRGFMAIINIHHYEEIMSNPVAHKERFLALWSQIADHYKNYSPNLYFELLNEPNGSLTQELWNQYFNQAITLIRGSGGSNATRKLIVGTANWGGIGSLEALDIPTSAEDPNIVVTVHYYNPFQFTHQGAEWVAGSNAWLGTTWWGIESQKAAVRAEFDAVADWAEDHDRQIFLGEFGAYSSADNYSRVKWTSCIVEEAEARNFSWAYWEFCSGFGVYSSSQEAWRKELLDTLIPE